jgi:hypothetical protein
MQNNSFKKWHSLSSIITLIIPPCELYPPDYSHAAYPIPEPWSSEKLKAQAKELVTDFLRLACDDGQGKGFQEEASLMKMARVFQIKQEGYNRHMDRCLLRLWQ